MPSSLVTAVVETVVSTLTADAVTPMPGLIVPFLGFTLLYVFLAVAVVWLLPLAFAVYTSLRPREETGALGYLSLPQTLNLDNYLEAWNRAELIHYFLNTLIIVVPAVLLVLLLASMMAFAI